MPASASRQQLIDYCLRRLGHPVLKIEIDDDQVEDLIDEALYYYQQYHYDATERFYLQHQLTSTNITDKYIDIRSVDSNIIGVNRIFPFTNSDLTRNMFDIRYQMRLQDIQSLLSASFTNYYITQTHLSMIDLLLVGQIPIEFSRHKGYLYLYFDWTTVSAGDYLVIECTRVLDPDTYTNVYSDIWLKRYATALIKRQWGTNTKKYEGVATVGGVEIAGQKIYDEAVQEIKDLEDQIESKFELPARMMVG